MALKVIIADDNAGMRLVLSKVLQKNPAFSLVAEASDGDECIRLAEEYHPDVCFLDVEMPGKTGVECARILQDMNPRTVLIFATAHEQYRADAFSVYAFDYLTKPFNVERLERTLARVLDQRSAHDSGQMVAQEALPAVVTKAPRPLPGRLLLKNREGAVFVDLSDILLVQRENRSTVIYALNDKRYVTGDSLGDMEEKLSGGPFFRSHKSYIINISFIEDITPYGRWTYIARLKGTKQDALITHEKFEELQNMFL